MTNEQIEEVFKTFRNSENFRYFFFGYMRDHLADFGQIRSENLLRNALRYANEESKK